MLLRVLILVGLPLATAFLFPSAGSGGGCCGAPACAPSCGPISSCGGGCSTGYSGGYSGYSGGYSPGGYSGGSYSSGGSYAAPSNYVQAPAAASYIPAPVAASYVPAPSVNAGYAKSSYSAPSAPVGTSYSAPASSSYSASAPPSDYNSAPANIPPPPPPPSQEVSPSPYIGHAAAGDKLQTVEDEEASAAAELSVVASSLNSTVVSEPSPPIDISLLKLTNDTECNSEELREIITQNMTENLNSSKRLIQVAAEEKFGGRFDVICSTSDFSYVTNTELFCQHTVNHVSCYSYRQL